jgi:hypothetical protein
MCVKLFVAQKMACTQTFLVCTKIVQRGEIIDERAFRRETCSLFHKLINNCVQNLMTAKYLWRLSEGIVQ